MKKFPIIIAFLLCLLAMAACHKDKEMDIKEAIVSNEEITVSATQARFSWQVDFVGQFHTGVELSQNENMSDLRRVEATKEEDGFVAIVDSLAVGKKYYYRIVVWNKFGSYEQPVSDFTTSKTFSIHVSAEPSIGGTVAGGGIFAEGDTCTVVAIANVGYNFVNWTENGTQVSTEAEYAFAVSNNRNLVAHFTSQEFTITATAEPEEGGTVDGSGGYNNGDECTLTATPNEGYTFINWIKDGTEVSTNPVCTFTVTETATYVAHFQIQSYTITVSANPAEGGSVEGGSTFEYGQSCTVHGTEANGYHFVNWTENGEQVSSDEEYTFTVTRDRDLVANFTSQAYLIQVQTDPEEGGTVTGAGGYVYGQECTLKATANEGYDFVNWTDETGSLISTESTYHFLVFVSAIYVAHFQAINYQISVSAEPEEGGTVTGGGNGFHYDDECTVMATANTNYVFANWTENGTVVSEEVSYTFSVTRNRILVANFTKQYTISVSADPSNGGTVSGGGTYNEGSTCTVTATANSGYTFNNWTENGQIVQSAGESYTFYVTCNRTLMANFEQTYPIGAINGLFTINDNGDQVYFSKGNLQYIGSASTPYWKFADNQWEYLGDNGQFSTNQNVDRDLFGWGTSGYHDSNDLYNVNYQPWSISVAIVNETYNRFGYGPSTNMPSPNLTDNSANYDWGIFNSINNTTTQWRTLTGGSSGEWYYVFNTRSASMVNGVPNARYAKACVNNVLGVVIFPDSYEHPSIAAVPENINNPGAGFGTNNWSGMAWMAMEEAGCVFLPAAGYRYGISANYVGSVGYYWSTSFGTSGYAYHVFFGPISLSVNYYDQYRFCGFSVRLVCPAQ